MCASRWFAPLLLVVFVVAPWLAGSACSAEREDGEADLWDQNDGSETGLPDTPDDVDDGIIMPDLRSISEAVAQHLGSYARQLETATAQAAARPIAWSMINQSCQERAMALQYALAVADPALGSPPAPMHETELVPATIDVLTSAPTFDSATIGVAGPLATAQTLRHGDGTPFAGEPLSWYWPYHYGVVINVEGELQVLDLSMADAPIPVSEWLRGIVADEVMCEHTSDATFATVWVYWNARFGNLPTETRPTPLCATIVTPSFTFRRDQTPSGLAPVIASVPATMHTQLDAFAAIVEQHYGMTLAESERAGITSHYEARTERDVCDWTEMDFCSDLP